MTAAAVGGRQSRPRLSRLGLVWAVWRQHRAASGWLLAALAVPLTIMAVTWHPVSRLAGLLARDGCPMHDFGNCWTWAADLQGYAARPVVLAVALIPVGIGVFAGAPLLAREYEQGTHRFAWTQGTGPAGWVMARLAILGGVTAVAMGLLGALGSIWIAPFERAGLVSRWQEPGFWLAPPAAVTWPLFLLCVGVLAGAVCRRTRWAMAVTLAAAILLGQAWPALLRSVYSIAPAIARGSPLGPPLGGLLAGNPSSAGQGPPGSLALAGWYTGSGGQRLSGAAARLTRSIPDRLNSLAAVRAWLGQHHLTYWVSYQPPGRFWLVQGLAATCLLAAAALLLAAAVWLVRWRSR